MSQLDDEQIRIWIDEILPTCGDNFSPFTLTYLVAEKAKKLGYQLTIPQRKAAVKYWWDLARQGYIVVNGSSQAADELGSAFLSIDGEKAFKQGSNSPHNPVRFIQNLKENAQDSKDIAFDYLEEAVLAYHARCYRSSAVMIGCAHEHLIRKLASTIIKSGKAHNSKKIEKHLNSLFGAASQLFSEVSYALKNMNLPSNFRDVVNRNLEPIFERARILRNDSGHPTGEKVTKDDAYASLILFKGQYTFIDEIISHVQSS